VPSAHEAGTLHADIGHRAPPWLRQPVNVNSLLDGLWARNVQRADDGGLAVAGVRITELAQEFGTPAYVLDEDDFRSRARTFRDAFATAFADLCGGADVFYAGKAFLCTGVARWIAEDGLGLDVCTGGELAVAERVNFPAKRIALHGNNKSIAELTRAVQIGVGRIIVDAPEEVGRLAHIAEAANRRVPVFVRITVGVEAHTHEYIATAHEDQKFGLSLTDGTAKKVVGDILALPQLELRGLHSHIGSQIFDTAGFEIAARRSIGLHAAVRDEYGIALPELGLGGGFGIRYTSQDDPMTAEELAAGLADIVAHECRSYDIACPKISVEPGRAIAGPSTFTLYEVGTVKEVSLDAGARRTYVAVDGGMSDNIRPALYDADFSATLASRTSAAQPVLARVVGKHCESGDIIVKDEFLPGDVASGDLIAVPATGAYCRSLANNYNHVPRPPVLAVRDGVVRVLMRRETLEDLLRLDAADQVAGIPEG
jgi:diaminopimelate decarboxylase